ncbi:MAG: alpha-1,2-fucosyltransferase [Alphaproteobacteria bacterium]|nr:alpha-1,2-fucosyltransferase [Alphaproteobacteria bacterium]
MKYRVGEFSSLSQAEFSVVKRLGLEAVIASRAELILTAGASEPQNPGQNLQTTQGQWLGIKADAALLAAVNGGGLREAARFLAQVRQDFAATVLLDLCPEVCFALVESSLDDRAGRLDLLLFDLGFVRLRTGLLTGRRLYLRSDLLDDLSLLGEAPLERRISMSSLGSNGRFANQLFQYIFLRLYGLRNNCRVLTPEWIGNHLYRIERESLPTDEPGLPMLQFQPFAGAELGLWYTDQPPIQVDFWGYFQVIPASYRHHRRLIQRLLRPVPEVARPIEQWLNSQLPAGATTVGIHIRRGDYVQLAPRVNEFRTVPLAPYLTALRELWPQLEQPRLVIATDAPELVPEFQDYDPLVAPAALLSFEPWGFFPDFHALSSCDHIFVVNSSFSRMASLLAKESTIVKIIDMTEQRFKPYSPWDDVYFWDRFEEE